MGFKTQIAKVTAEVLDEQITKFLKELPNTLGGGIVVEVRNETNHTLDLKKSWTNFGSHFKEGPDATIEPGTLDLFSVALPGIVDFILAPDGFLLGCGVIYSSRVATPSEASITCQTYHKSADLFRGICLQLGASGTLGEWHSSGDYASERGWESAQVQRKGISLVGQAADRAWEFTLK